MAGTEGASNSLVVGLRERSYPIHIGDGLLADPTWIGSVLAGVPRVVLVSNTTVWPLHGERLAAGLRKAGKEVIRVELPDGEAYKDWPTLQTIFDVLLANRCDRSTPIIALGGGVVGDMAGFAASAYQRGVPYVQVPTTLLAQVDSSVGGKTAINHPLGKNMIGSFHQPIAVLADTAVLRTLPEREFISGLAEVVKYGLILDGAFFDWLDAHVGALLAREHGALAHAIRRSCEIKADVVAADEREVQRDGGRAMLNLGHTFGHAIESCLGYGTWLHGEAVACGMVLAAELSREEGLLDDKACGRVATLLSRMGLPVHLPAVFADEMLSNMGRDKKNEGGRIRLILLERIGQAIVTSSVSTDTLRAFLGQRGAR